MKLNIVPPRTGLGWVRAGLRTFFRQPLALTGLFFMYVAVVVVLAPVPVVGVVLGGMLVPAATLGLMAASAEVTQGRFPLPTILLTAFRAGRKELRAMLVLGALYAAGSLLTSALASWLAGPPQAAAPAAGAGPSLDATLVLDMVLHLPLVLMFWHAPALVHWHGVEPVKALFFSVVAVMRNFGAHLFYCLAWLGVFALVSTVSGVVGSLLGGTALAQAMMIPLALLMAAMFSSSVYFTFRDSFQSDAQPAQEQAA